MLASLAGWAGLHLWLTALGLAGIPWSGPLILGAAAAFYLLAWKLLPAFPGQEQGPVSQPGGFGWGEGLALAALLVFTAGALSLWTANPDFVYHWGLKGHRFYLAHGVDYPYLARHWNWVIHPDYPNLLPELFAATALLAGRFDEPAMMLWSAIGFGLLLAAVRETLRRAGASRFVAQATLAALAMSIAAYGIAGLSAGGADWLLAGVYAVRLWTARGASRPEPPVAPATATESEAPPAPAAAAHPARLARLRLALGPNALAALDWRAVAALVVPVAAVVLPWLVEVQRYRLFQDFNSGPLRLARLPDVLAAAAVMLGAPPWHGFAFGLALLPLLALDRRLRAIAAVIALQLLFYLYVYLSVRLDPVMLLEASFQRLLLHLLPAVRRVLFRSSA